MKTKRTVCLSTLRLYLNVSLAILVFCLSAAAQNNMPNSLGPILLTENDKNPRSSLFDSDCAHIEKSRQSLLKTVVTTFCFTLNSCNKY